MFTYDVCIVQDGLSFCLYHFIASPMFCPKMDFFLLGAHYRSDFQEKSLPSIEAIGSKIMVVPSCSGPTT